MADDEQLKALSEEVERLRVAMKDQNEQIRKQEEALKQKDEQRPVVMMSSRRLDRFRDRPSSSSDPTITEWISDMRSQAASRKLTAPEFSHFLLDNLAGKARQEILGRGDSVKQDPEEIIKVLFKVFGDGDNLPLLQQKFYAYKQDEEDLITCSLNMVELYDKIVHLDQSFQACRDASLKGRFAEAVKDEGLKRELRRLNLESPGLKFFEMRDRAVHWMGNLAVKRSATCHEVESNVPDVKSESTELLEVVKRQEGLIEKQQQQITSLLSKIGNNKGTKQRQCWTCGSTQHLQRNCTKSTKVKPRGRSNPLN